MSAINWDVANSIIRLIDRTNSTPTLVYDILANKKYARIVIDQGDNVVPTCVLFLHVGTDGVFTTTAPILNNKEAVDNYLLEVKLAQNIGGVIKFSRLHRFRLSAPTIVEDPDLGQVMQINCEHIAFQALKENLTSLNEELVNPADRVEHLVTFYNSENPTGVFITALVNGLPTKESLKRDYFPTSPISLEDAFQEVLDILKEPPPLGGSFKNYYWFVEASPGVTNGIQITFDEFGRVNSNVTITATSSTPAAALTDRTAMTSNKKRRNVVVVKYHPRGAAIPMEHTKFASKFLHAKFRQEWDTQEDYAVGDLVKYTDTSTTPYTIRFFKCIVAVPPGPNPTPDADSTKWFEDFTTIPPWNLYAYYTPGEIVTVDVAGTNRFYKCTVAVGPTSTSPLADPGHWVEVFNRRPTSNREPFFTYTPFTFNIDSVKKSLAAVASPPAGYLGYALDWNYRRQINDLRDYTNRYKLVTGRAIKKTLSTPPTGIDLYDGLTVKVGVAPTGAFTGQTSKIAEYVKPIFGVGSWKFSDAPVEGDTIYNIETGNFEYYHLSSWTIIWNPSNNTPGPPYGNEAPGPAHAVKSMQLVKGATEIPGQAVQLRFNWKDALGGGNDINRTSRGGWYHQFYPIPFETSLDHNLGALYGGDGIGQTNNPMVSHQNLNVSQHGQYGWNNGSESETHGRISAHMIKIKYGVFTSTDDTLKVYGKSMIPAVYWRVDANGRVFFQDFVIPNNDEYFTLTVGLPPFARTNLYFNRLNELAEIFGYTLPVQLPLQEKDYSAIQYEWKKNQSWGVFIKDHYQEYGFYTGCYSNTLDQVGGNLTQAWNTTLALFDAIARGDWAKAGQLVTTGTTIDHSTLTIDEDHYIKEGYAIYPPTEQLNAQAEVYHMEEETDYLTALAKAEALYYQLQFFPEERWVGTTGNVEIQYGYQVTETGIRVPGGSVTSTVARMKQTIDNRGFNCELYLVKKFTVS